MSRRDPVLDRWREDVRRALPDAPAELVEEIAVHVTERWSALRASGRSAADADAAAQAEIEAWHRRPAARVRRDHPGDRRRWGAGFWLDLAAARRRLAVQPLSSLGGLLLVALATAASVAVFSLAQAIVWRPLPYPDASRLVAIWEQTKGETIQISYPDFDDFRKTGAFDASAALSAGVGTLFVDGAGTADRVQVVEAEPALLSMMGAKPAYGRLLTPDDDGKPVAVLSHELWESHFHGDPAAVGRTFGLSGRTYTIAGVLAGGVEFELPVPGGFNVPRVDLWTSFDHQFSFVTRRDVYGYEALGRLAPGVALADARRRADATASVLARDFAATNQDRQFRLEPLREWIAGRAIRPLQLACVAALMVVLIALANLITLMLGRLSARQTELAVRQSLGASRWRLARQVIVDEAMVVLAGGALGVGAGIAIARALAASPAAALPRAAALAVDGGVAWFAIAVVALLWIVPIVVALRLQRAPASLRSDTRVLGRTARRARRVLVAGEIALALVLVTGAALLSLAIARLFAVDPGFATSRTLALRMSAYPAAFPTKDAVTAFFNDAAEAARALPGVERAAASASLPLSGVGSSTSLMSAERPLPPASRPSAGWQFVTPGYFQAAGIPIVRGRDFEPADVTKAPHVTVLNQAAARELFGDDDPIGRRVSIGGGEESGDWHVVIGVVGDVRYQALSADPSPRAYDLLGQHWGRTMYLVVRSRPGVDAGALAPTVRRTIAALSPTVPVFDVATIEGLVNRSVAPQRLAATLGGGLALVSFLLALVGTVAVVSCTVSERTREMGVRLALGATRAQILGLVLREASITAIGGCLAGLAGGLLAARALAGQLFGVHMIDAFVLVPALAAALALASVAAAWWPARRATRADPLRALHAVGE